MPTDEGARPRWRIASIYFFQAFAAGSFLTRIPDIQRGLAIDEGVLGLALFGQSLGSIVFFPFASSVIERTGTRPVILLGLPALALMVALVSVAPHPALMSLALAGYGAIFSFTGVAMNVEADRIEAVTGQRVLGLCHGLSSLGLLLVSLLGALLRGIGTSPVLHLWGLLPFVVLASLLLVLPMRPSPPRAHSASGPRRVIARPSRMTFLLVGVLISGGVLEGMSRTWSIIYMRDTFTAPDWLDSLALPAFLLSMSGGRLLGDGWATRFGPARTARVLLAVAGAGLLLVAAAPIIPVGLFGFAVIGLGTSVLYPLSISAAARLGDRPASENVAAITLVGSLIVLGVPPALGSIANHWGIRTIFVVVLPVLALSFLLAPLLDRRRGGAATPPGSSPHPPRASG